MIKIFVESELRAFSLVSWDRNPLHCDFEYARATPFGRPVVFGVYAVLVLLRAWLGGRSAVLSSLSFDFKKPIFLDEEYSLKIVSRDGGAELSLQQNGRTHLKAKVSECLGPFTAPAREGAFVGRSLANEGVVGNSALASEHGPAFYRANWEGVPHELELPQIPLEQLEAILWSSYVVGMEIPGKQALFSQAEFVFAQVPLPDNALSVAVDERFKRVEIFGHSPALTSFRIFAFQRPPPIQSQLANVKISVGVSDDFKGRNVLVTGGSRGFGAAVAQAYALHGARVGINYATSAKAAQALTSELREAGAQASAFQADVADPQSCRRLAEECRRELGSIDVLFNSAFPLIPVRALREQSGENIGSFVALALRLFIEPFRESLPLLPPGALVVYVSSVYVIRPEPLFSHYIAAKSAVEGLIKSLAGEYPTLRFLVLRPGKMLTDQTNAITPPGQALINPEAVVKRYFAEQKQLRWTENYHELNLA